ncbi:hypothetical protein H310_09236 [Aphanomyces invadans]|nr:hypothetical protein H310_09236 [Aphanomyces invadans]ETV97919.1 hypothetical protein H310_09236 [Aphanomyces invadans]|eukprot:XP_008873480.1 hypothetical protein H310_09236 [Aphanomyces invadans]
MNILIVEADAWFEGHRRVRVAKGASLDNLRAALHDQLRLPNDVASMSITLYDTPTQSIVPLRHGHQIQSHTRLFLSPSSDTASQPVLAIASRSFGFAFERGEFRVHGVPLYIGEVGNTGKGTGLTIWDGSVVLARYLEHVSLSVGHDDNVRGKRVLELGAGTGLVGLAASLCGASHVTLTDLAYALENLSRNVELNRGAISPAAVAVSELDWFAPQSSSFTDGVDMVVGSDIVWVESLIEPLVQTIAVLLKGGRVKASTMLLAHQTRCTASDAIFFQLVNDHGLVVASIDAPPAILPQDKHIRLYKIQVPAND